MTQDKIIKYYCREHSFDRSKPLKENKGLCQCMGGCGMLAAFEVEEYLKVVNDYFDKIDEMKKRYNVT